MQGAQQRVGRQILPYTIVPVLSVRRRQGLSTSVIVAEEGPEASSSTGPWAESSAARDGEEKGPLPEAKRSPKLPQLEPKEGVKPHIFELIYALRHPLGEKSAMLLRVPDVTFSTQ